MSEISQHVPVHNSMPGDPEKRQRLTSIVKGHRLLEDLELQFRNIKPDPVETDLEGRVTKSVYPPDRLQQKNELAKKIVQVHRAIVKALDDVPDYTDLEDLLRTML